MLRATLLLATVVLAACGVLAARGEETPKSVTSVDAEVRRLLNAAEAKGAVCVVDVETGATVASVGVGQDPTAAILPLSAIKLFVASLWWDLRLDDRPLSDPRKGWVTLHEVLVVGYDTPGAEAALVLRNALGSERMLALLREQGLGVSPGKLLLGRETSDVIWGEALSIGEANVEVTLEQIARFLRKACMGDSASSRRMRSALRDAVARGSASSVAARLEGTGWSLGGKTGTGPASAAPDYDGSFCGLIFKGDKARYAFAVYIQSRGKGGGVAAGIAADLAKWFASQERRTISQRAGSSSFMRKRSRSI